MINRSISMSMMMSNNNNNDNELLLLMKSKKKKNKFGSGAAKRGRYEEEEEDNDNEEKQKQKQKKLKLKGVVAQQNGHWGAQIYAEQKRIWLGTFKSEREAAMAYDSATIKLRRTHRRNFPCNNHQTAVQEPLFQSHYTTQAVLAMIRDGSYPSKFATFLLQQEAEAAATVDDDKNNNNNNIIRRRVIVSSGDDDEQLLMMMMMCCSRAELLFKKELTPSDVGKLNRLVIPKKHALSCFPLAAGAEDAEVVFYDKLMRSWKFRYCYWKSSQSYVFTRGWNRFVKDFNLKPKDIIAFYFCDPTTTNMQQQLPFSLIDVIYTTTPHDHDHDDDLIIDTKQTILSSQVRLEEDQHNTNNNGIGQDDSIDLNDENAPKGSLRLFGVCIN